MNRTPAVEHARLTLRDRRIAHFGTSLIDPRWVLTAAHCVSADLLDPQPVPTAGANIDCAGERRRVLAAERFAVERVGFLAQAAGR